MLTVYVQYICVAWKTTTIAGVRNVYNGAIQRKLLYRVSASVQLQLQRVPCVQTLWIVHTYTHIWMDLDITTDYTTAAQTRVSLYTANGRV